MRIIWSKQITADGSPVTIEVDQSQWVEITVKIGDVVTNYLAFRTDELSTLIDALREAKYEADKMEREREGPIEIPKDYNDAG